MQLMESLTPLSCGYFALCVIVHAVVNLSTKPIASSLGLAVPAGNQAELHNQVISGCHAALFATLHVYIWLFSESKDEEYQDADGIHSLDHIMLEIMIGYMMYDTSFEVFMMFADKKKAWAAHLQILLHHLMGLVTHAWILRVNSGIAARLMTVIYGADMSTPFLNLSWIMHHFGLSNNKVFTVVTGLVFISFLYRLTIGPYVLYCLIVRHKKWTYFPYLYSALCGVASVFSLLNFYWFYKLYQRAANHHKKLAKEEMTKNKTDDANKEEVKKRK